MKVYYHSVDNDGKGAAAIVNYMIQMDKTFESLSSKDFIGYFHNNNITIADFQEGEEVFIVDLSLEDNILQVVQAAKKKNCKIVHIDHHQTSINTLQKNTKARSIMKGVTKFYVVGISACLLTWIYSNMDDEQRKHPMRVKFDLMNNRKRMSFINDDGKPVGSPRLIPNCVRYIDDHDLFEHKIDGSIPFMYGSRSYDLSPWNDGVWKSLLYDTGGVDSILLRIMGKGTDIADYQKEVDAAAMNKSFVKKIFGEEILFVNTSYGNSLMFGDYVNQYPLIGKYFYTGEGNWHFSIYKSTVLKDEAAKHNIVPIAEYFRGGGHDGACGFTIKKNILDDDRPTAPWNKYTVNDIIGKTYRGK